MAGRRCSECGTINDAARRFCSSCGALLAIEPDASELAPRAATDDDPTQPMAAASGGAPSQPITDATPPWVETSGSVAPIITVKPPDKPEVDTQPAVEIGSWSCPQCQTVNGASRRFCSSCGYVRVPTVPVTPVVVGHGDQPSLWSKIRPVLFRAVAGAAAVAILAVGGLAIARAISGGGAGSSPGPGASSTPDGGSGGETSGPETQPPDQGVVIVDVAGKQPSDAREALEALCGPVPCVTVEYRAGEGDGADFGVVVGTDPAAGESITPGGTVSVVVSVGDQSTDGEWYEVRRGDTFSMVANDRGFRPWQDLKPFNPGMDYNHIEVGELIWIPSSH